MDIERLKELRKKIPEYYGNGFMSLVHCDNMLDLIDEAIARQSEIEKVVCPDCGGSGIYREYDEYDRYYLHTCGTCEGSGDVDRQQESEG